MLRFLSLIPTPVLIGVNLLFCVFFVMDSVQSIQAALDLKQMLARLSAEREKWLAAMPRPKNLRQKMARAARNARYNPASAHSFAFT